MITRKRKLKERSGGHRKQQRPSKRSNIRKEEEPSFLIETTWHDLPIEMVDFILHLAAHRSKLTSVVIPFVCWLWYERKRYWKPEVDFTSSTSVFNGLQQDYLNRLVAEEAAVNGWVHVLQWLRSNGCPLDSWTCAGAQGGHLETLKWLRSNRVAWDSWTCAKAAEGGHLKVLQWACEKDKRKKKKKSRPHGPCPWDATVCSLAASGGHLEVLKWLRANGCPWNFRTTQEAARRGHIEMLEWLGANTACWSPATCSCGRERTP